MIKIILDNWLLFCTNSIVNFILPSSPNRFFCLSARYYYLPLLNCVHTKSINNHQSEFLIDMRYNFTLLKLQKLTVSSEKTKQKQVPVCYHSFVTGKEIVIRKVKIG